MAAHETSDTSQRRPVLTAYIAPNLARGFLSLAADDIHVDARGPPVLDPDFAIDQPHRDISSVARVHQVAKRVDLRRQMGPLEIKYDEVGALSDFNAADRVGHAECLGSAARRHVEDVSALPFIGPPP